MIPEYDAFISYSRRNSVFVKRLVSDLQNHHVKVWLDTLEIKVGDQFRQCIENGIERSRFFCFIISNASLQSYFARRVELEAAFAMMAREQRNRFILPLRLQCTESIPLQLSTFHYLDFSSPKSYMPNLNLLVKRLLQIDENFTGTRLYKSVDTSMSGTMVGMGEPLRQPPHRGSYIRVFFNQGRIRFMETYSHGRADGAKSVVYDPLGRVSEIALFRDNKLIDTWQYEYDEKTGLRKYKWVCRPGATPHQRLEYDRCGNKIRESNVNPDGLIQACDEGWAIKQYVRDKEGNVVAYRFLNERNKLIRTEQIG